MRLNAPFAGFYQNYQLSDGSQSPDGLNNYGLVSIPAIIAGKNSANAVTFDRPMGITPGTESFQNAYFLPEQPTSSVHDWNLTVEKEVMHETVLRAAYVGRHAVDQDSYNDWNAPMSDYVWVTTKKLTPPTGVARNTALRPNDKLPYGDLQEYRKDGWGWSNGMQLELQRRYAKGVAFQVFYMLMNVNKAASHGWYGDSSLAPVNSFLPGSVPTDDAERMRLLLYKRDTTVPKHEIRWNWIGDLPFGKGKALAGNANKYLNSVIGGWQISGMGRWRSNWFSLPTDIWPTGAPVEYYDHKYPIEDCRGGACRPGYLLWNGYIPAHQINSHDANGKPNGVMGVPDNLRISPPRTAWIWAETLPGVRCIRGSTRQFRRPTAGQSTRPWSKLHDPGAIQLAVPGRLLQCLQHAGQSIFAGQRWHCGDLDKSEHAARDAAFRPLHLVSAGAAYWPFTVKARDLFRAAAIEGFFISSAPVLCELVAPVRDIHKRMLAVVVADVAVEGEYQFERWQLVAAPINCDRWRNG